MKYLRKISSLTSFVGISALILSVSFAYYFFFYLPNRHDLAVRRQNQEIYQKAAIECDKGTDEILDKLPIGGDTMDEKVRSFKGYQNIEVLLEKSREDCLSNKLSRWGYDPDEITNNK